MEDFGKIFGDIFDGAKFSSESEIDEPIDIGADPNALINKVYTMLRPLVTIRLQPTKQGNYAITQNREKLDVVEGDSTEAKRAFIDYCLDS